MQGVGERGQKEREGESLSRFPRLHPFISLLFRSTARNTIYAIIEPECFLLERLVSA